MDPIHIGSSFRPTEVNFSFGANNGTAGPGNSYVTNADVLRAEWDIGTNVCIAIQATGQALLDNQGVTDGSFYLKSLLRNHLPDGDARKKYAGTSTRVNYVAQP